MEKAKILLVDDRPENLLALEGILRADDRVLFKAESGRHALELLIQHDFALAVLDVQMPEMSGLELASLMRDSDDTQNIPIIFVTAGSRDQAVAFQGFEAGAVDFLYKPLNEKIVRSKVKVFLDLYRQKMLLQEQVERLEASEKNLKTSEAALEATNRDLERFAYVASHDMKEPLRMISSYLSLLEKNFGDKLDADAKEYISFAVNGSQRLASLISSLIQHSTARHTELQLNPHDSNVILKEVLQDLSSLIADKKANVTYAELPVVYCDRPQLRQLFQNLISNAMKFTEGNPPRIKISCEVTGTGAVFRIEDNGIGIDESLRKKIFEPFVRGHGREKFAGDGIGLSICKTIVERHHGRIWVEAGVDGGSVFAFFLPSQPPASDSLGKYAPSRSAG